MQTLHQAYLGSDGHFSQISIKYLCWDLKVMKRAIRNFVIGKRTYIESWNEYKQVMLSGQFAIAGILACSIYLLIDLAWGVYSTIPVYMFGIGLLSVALYLHRKGDHCTANYFLFPTLNLIVYIFASSEDHTTGATALFIPVA
jgi:hypothetical protein